MGFLKVWTSSGDSAQHCVNNINVTTEIKIFFYLYYFYTFNNKIFYLKYYYYIDLFVTSYNRIKISLFYHLFYVMLLLLLLLLLHN